jgi:SAM-dependent methyltransferase
MVDNRHAYKQEKVVKIYTGVPRLFEGEAVLIRKYKEQLGNSVFLDIGIGGGRTTHFIEPIVNKYYGVDYSVNFVEHVGDKYAGQNNVVIEFGDARELKQYENIFFDFILFSFNGIDCVSFDDRTKIIREAFRLLKPGGHFWFSFHNIYSLPKLYSFQWPKNPFNWVNEWKRSKKIKQLNGSIEQYKNKKYCFLCDGAELFEAEVMYIIPELQSEMLRESGFKEIYFYDAQKGGLLPLNTKTRNADWIYADCIKPSIV